MLRWVGASRAWTIAIVVVPQASMTTMGGPKRLPGGRALEHENESMIALKGNGVKVSMAGRRTAFDPQPVQQKAAGVAGTDDIASARAYLKFGQRAGGINVFRPTQVRC